MLNILATAHGERITWEKNGEQHHGLSVMADKVLTVYATGKARKSARDAEEVETTT